MYQLIYGQHPFQNLKHDKILFEEKLKGFQQIEFPTDQEASSHAKHLIDSLLQRSVGGRYSPTQALEHPWVTR
jgi:serine/threonine protein kinase